jgi:hypothetical protein
MEDRPLTALYPPCRVHLQSSMEIVEVNSDLHFFYNRDYCKLPTNALCDNAASTDACCWQKSQSKSNSSLKATQKKKKEKRKKKKKVRTEWNTQAHLTAPVTYDS